MSMAIPIHERPKAPQVAQELKHITHTYTTVSFGVQLLADFSVFFSIYTQPRAAIGLVIES